MKSISNIISISLIGLGVVGFVISSRPVLGNQEIDVPLNVLGINRSPYGEVFAMAMQGPIDNYWHAVESGGAAHSCDGCKKCEHQTQEKKKKIAGKADAPLDVRLRNFIEAMDEGVKTRTNARPASDAHKFHLRRGIEDKLRFAYNLDPSHYGNYNAYHFFLTEPQLGTRPELTPYAAKLAEDTINYCLSRRDDPRRALTAAAAAGNVLELMLNDRAMNSENSRYTTKQMLEVLKLMDHSIAVYQDVANQWTEQGLWANLSKMRLIEVEERLYFIKKVRESHGQSILRIVGFPGISAVDRQSINLFVS